MTTSTSGRAPGVLIQFVDPPPEIEPVQVDVPAFVCVCERGPLHTPVRIGSWPEFTLVFGTFIGNGLGAYAAKAFFEQGGRVCWVVRVAAAEHVTAATGPQPADRLSSQVVAVDGFVVGAAATVRQGTETHTYLVTGVDPTTSTASWDRPLHPAIDITLPFDVAVGAAAASGVVTAGGAPALQLLASGPGAWGNTVTAVVAMGRKAATANRPDEPATNAATPVHATDGFFPGSTVRVSQDIAAAVTRATAVVARVDRARRVLWWDAPLPAAIVPGQRFALETSTFTLSVQEHGATREVWPDLSTVEAHPRYAPAVLTGSRLLGPATVLAAGSEPDPGRFALAGGRDGTAALAVADILGDELVGDGHGVAALHDIAEPAAVAVPDLVASATPPRVLLPPPDQQDPCAPCPPPPGAPPAMEAIIVEAGAAFGAEEIVAAQQRLVESCEANAERIAVLDPPAGSGPMTTAELAEWAGRFSSSYAVANAPWLTVVDPLTPTGSGVRRVPPSGHMAGIIAQTDALDGAWRASANRNMAWAHGLDTVIDDPHHAVLNEAGVNVIRARPGRGPVPMGARTLSADPLWVYTQVRRTMIFLRRTLRQALAWVVFEPNGSELDRMLAAAVSSLLLDVWEAGGLAGDTPRRSFYVAVDQSVKRAGEQLIEIGVALVRPAEFVTVRVSRSENRLELTEAPVRVEGMT